MRTRELPRQKRAAHAIHDMGHRAVLDEDHFSSELPRPIAT